MLLDKLVTWLVTPEPVLQAAKAARGEVEPVKIKLKRHIRHSRVPKEIRRIAEEARRAEEARCIEEILRCRTPSTSRYLTIDDVAPNTDMSAELEHARELHNTAMKKRAELARQRAEQKRQQELESRLRSIQASQSAMILAAERQADAIRDMDFHMILNSGI